MRMTQKQQIRNYRKTIQELSEENENLKEHMKQYGEEGLSVLVDETMKLKSEYETLIKEAIKYRNEYEILVKNRQKINSEYQEKTDSIQEQEDLYGRITT